MEDKNKLTVYKNELNMIPFRNFTSVEMDLFFSILTDMRDKGLQEVIFTFDELKEISKYSRREKDRFISAVEHTYEKMTKLSYRKEDKKTIEYFILFNGFKIDKDEEYVEITTNPKLQHIINQISGEFTKFELDEFLSLKSSYTKNAYRFLKQFRQTGFWKVSVVDFRRLLDVPESYQMGMLTKTVLTPIKQELQEIFEGLEIRKIKAKKSNRIEFFEFHFFREDDVSDDGKKTFRDDDGFYYEKDLEHFNNKEIEKTFPEVERESKKERKSYYDSLHKKE